VGISDIIIKPGLINVDFADVKSVMSNAGTALMGIGHSTGMFTPYKYVAIVGSLCVGAPLQVRREQWRPRGRRSVVLC
jgi:cell division GTPase FtsZ